MHNSLTILSIFFNKEYMYYKIWGQDEVLFWFQDMYERIFLKEL